MNIKFNFLQIYIWRIFSIGTGFLSLLIVIPHLSNNPEIFGIYSFCVSFTIYLTYADIGFLGSGQKYAAEEYAKGNRVEEIKILGFTGAFLLAMTIPFTLCMVFLGIYPELVFNSISLTDKGLAAGIFFTLGIAIPPIILLQRITQSILSIRIKDYLAQRIDVLANMIKIFSVFFFFRKGYYMIVEYFVFINIITFFSSFIIIRIISKREKYDFLFLLKSLKITKTYFYKLKKLSFSSLALTIGWLIYYELDLIYAGFIFTPVEVAYYSIGFSVLNFLRTLYNTLYSPFLHRFNHFVAVSDQENLKKLLISLIDYTLPLCFLVTLVLFIIIKYLVIFWVGIDFYSSILILKFLVLGTLMNFIVLPSGYYIIASEKHKVLYILSIVLPTAFLVLSILLLSTFGVLSFAISKSFAMLLGAFIYFISVRSIVKVEKILLSWTIPLVISGAIIILFFPLVLQMIFPVLEKSSKDLMLLFIISGFVIFFFYLFVMLFKMETRNYLIVQFKTYYSRFGISKV